LLEELGVLDDFGLKRKKASPKPKDGGDGKTAPPADGVKDPRERDRARREATTTPSGDGAPAAAADRPPKGQTHGQRMGWLRDRLGLAKKR
jgi:hypothetical protein